MNGVEDQWRGALAILTRGAEEIGFPLSPEQEDQFLIYGRLLHETNARFNLTAIRTPEGIMQTLFLDSLTCLLGIPSSFTEENSTPRLLDVGSGAGLPGIPLKLMFPRWHLDLVDSTRKKVTFLQGVVAALGLKDTEARWSRAEDLATDSAMAKRADLCTARALSSLEKVVRWCAPLVRQEGFLVLPRSGDVALELSNADHVMEQHGVCLHLMVPVPNALELGTGRVILLLRKTG